MNFATYGDGGFVSRSQEMLPKDFEPSANGLITPMTVFGLFLVLQLAWGMIRIRKGQSIVITDRFLLFLTGLIGLMVFGLWFLTDHTTTKWNMNILWANPLHLYLAFTGLKKKWMINYMKILSVILVILIVGWFFIPQRLHLATLPMIIGLLFITLRQLRPAFFGGEKLA
jgi:hypothetical protein